jgi:hypothetical protein
VRAAEHPLALDECQGPVGNARCVERVPRAAEGVEIDEAFERCIVGDPRDGSTTARF